MSAQIEDFCAESSRSGATVEIRLCCGDWHPCRVSVLVLPADPTGNEPGLYRIDPPCGEVSQVRTDARDATWPTRLRFPTLVGARLGK